jgi:hypothetical protein
LVAFLNRRDQYNSWATDQWGQIEPPLLTCEPVITEACFVLGHVPSAVTEVFELLKRQVIRLPFDLEKEMHGVSRLLRRYGNIPMSLADACLVRMAEMQARRSVLTLDADFRIYRMHTRQTIPTLLPPGR